MRESHPYIYVFCLGLLVQTGADSADTRYQQGLASLRSRDFSQALIHGRRAVELAPAVAEHHHLLGLALGGLNDIAAAIAAVERAISIKPSQPDFHYDLGLLYTQAGRAQAALESFKRAVDLDPDNLQGRLFLGRSYHNLNFSDLARRQFEQILKRDRRFPGVHFHLATIHKNAGDLGSALAELETEVANYPSDSLARTELAEVLLRLGESSRALQHLLAAARIKPGEARIFYLIGKAEWDTQQPARAIAALKRAAELQPNFAEPHYVLSQIYQQTGQTGLAKEELARFEKLRAR